MRITFPALSLLMLAACAAGPDYHGPEAAKPATPGAQFARTAEGVRADAPAAAAWWTALGDPVLDTLVSRALASNPGIDIAQARMRQARAALRLERTSVLPSTNASALYVHATVPGVDLGSGDNGGANGGESGGGSQSLNFYNLGFDASWELDLWGGKRRGVEAARAQFDAAEADIADAQVSLSADVAQAYVNLRDRQQRLGLAQQLLSRRQEMLRLTQQRFDQGTASALEVEQQRSLTEQAQSAMAALSAEQDAYLNALATLVGEAPGALDPMLAPTTGAHSPIPLPPAEVAVGDPAALLKRRPDIRAAERRYAAATARIGVAEAARFPSVSFLGLIGIGGTRPGDVLDFDQLAAIAMPRISWNFLDFGRNAARVGQAQAARDEAAAAYRQSVLGALRDSETALSRFGASRLTVASTSRAKASADRTAALMRQRFDAGTATRIQWLDAERESLSAAQALSQATGAMTADYIALQKALGLGWQPSHP